MILLSVGFSLNYLPASVKLSIVNLCKQFCRAWSGSKLFDILMVDQYLKEFFENAFNFSCFLVVCWFFFKISFFQSIISGIPSECDTIWIEIRPDVLWVLNCEQTVCKGYHRQQVAGTELIFHKYTGLVKQKIREPSGSVVDCLTPDRWATGSNLTGVTALWSLSKTHLS